MSANTIDYKDARVDAGGDRAYDSSSYGTTTGDLRSTEEKKSQGDFGLGESVGPDGKLVHDPERASPPKSAGAGSIQDTAGQLGNAATSTAATSGKDAGDLTTGEARVAQGYTKAGSMDPEVGA